MMDTLKFRWLHQNLALHKQRTEHAQGTLNVEDDLKHVDELHQHADLLRRKRQQRQEEADSELKRENARLVGKLCSVVRESEIRQRDIVSTATCSMPGTLNTGTRRQAAQRIDKENHDMLGRLQKAKPYIATLNQLATRYNAHEQLVARHSRIKRRASDLNNPPTALPPRNPKPPSGGASNLRHTAPLASSSRSGSTRPMKPKGLPPLKGHTDVLPPQNSSDARSAQGGSLQSGGSSASGCLANDLAPLGANTSTLGSDLVVGSADDNASNALDEGMADGNARGEATDGEDDEQDGYQYGFGDAVPSASNLEEHSWQPVHDAEELNWSTKNDEHADAGEEEYEADNAVGMSTVTAEETTVAATTSPQVDPQLPPGPSTGRPGSRPGSRARASRPSQQLDQAAVDALAQNALSGGLPATLGGGSEVAVNADVAVDALAQGALSGGLLAELAGASKVAVDADVAVDALAQGALSGGLLAELAGASEAHDSPAAHPEPAAGSSPDALEVAASSSAAGVAVTTAASKLVPEDPAAVSSPQAHAVDKESNDDDEYAFEDDRGATAESVLSQPSEKGLVKEGSTAVSDMQSPDEKGASSSAEANNTSENAKTKVSSDGYSDDEYNDDENNDDDFEANSEDEGEASKAVVPSVAQPEATVIASNQLAPDDEYASDEEGDSFEDENVDPTTKPAQPASAKPAAPNDSAGSEDEEDDDEFEDSVEANRSPVGIGGEPRLTTGDSEYNDAFENSHTEDPAVATRSGVGASNLGKGTKDVEEDSEEEAFEEDFDEDFEEMSPTAGKSVGL